MGTTDAQDKERILTLLRPYAANWTGTLGRGDLVVPQREIPRLINDLLGVMQATENQAEASDAELFQALTEARRSPSVQDQVSRLRHSFRILRR